MRSKLRSQNVNQICLHSDAEGGAVSFLSDGRTQWSYEVSTNSQFNQSRRNNKGNGITGQREKWREREAENLLERKRIRDSGAWTGGEVAGQEADATAGHSLPAHTLR